MFRQGGPFVRKIVASSRVGRKVHRRSLQMEANRARGETHPLSMQYSRTSSTNLENSLGRNRPAFSLPQLQPFSSFGNFSLGLPISEEEFLTLPDMALAPPVNTYKQVVGENLVGGPVQKTRSYLLSIVSSENLDMDKVLDYQHQPQQSLFDWTYSALNREQAPFFVLHKIVMDIAKRTGRLPTTHALQLLLRSACSEALQTSADQTPEAKEKQLGNIHLALNDFLSRGITPPLDSFKEIFSVFSQLNYIAAIAQLDSIMLKYKVLHDDASWSLVLNSLVATHGPRHIDTIFQSHLELGAQPGLLVFNRIIKYYGKMGYLSKMIDYLHLMTQLKVPANQETLYNLCLAYGSLNRVEEMTISLLIMKEAFQLIPESATLRLMFTILIQSRCRNEFETLFTELLRVTKQPSSSVSSVSSSPSLLYTPPSPPQVSPSTAFGTIFSLPSPTAISSSTSTTTSSPPSNPHSPKAQPVHEMNLDQLISVSIQDVWSNRLIFEMLNRPELQQHQPSIHVYRRSTDLLVASQPPDEKDILLFSEAFVQLFSSMKRHYPWIDPALLENAVKKLTKVLKGSEKEQIRSEEAEREVATVTAEHLKTLRQLLGEEREAYVTSRQKEKASTRKSDTVTIETETKTKNRKEKKEKKRLEALNNSS